MHVLLTRPSFQAELTRPLLEQRGCEVSVEPVLNVSSADPGRDALRDADIFVVTSVYASLHIVDAGFLKKTTPIYAVGAGTAAPLRQAGFSQVFQADGDAESLLHLILKEVRPTDGAIAYLSGRDITTDIAQDLVSRGYRARRIVVYGAAPARRLSDATQDLIRRRSIDCVIFMSYRTAHFFTELCHSAGLSDCLGSVTAAALSDKVASGLEGDRWKEVLVAEAPSSDAIITLLCPSR
ncbi:uroporphyrinogen-III synthase [Sedimentitalea sp. JM2-8]|uniref:Uroporphyrinogen-III synthase n=1 Tax=Sedimentitalea xiamensis TaxID=3050037 RepID=A0ABT7FKS2_9RHOB|nr:uroporphyrinogen-III synthase [Sedimentitalea xiamensis]MDK3075658.1 uroporphyrinogen-III synthase [Sedimentitalea xiamensis]